MAKCPDCGRENVEAPSGYLTLCGRRVLNADSPAVRYPAPGQWQQRMAMTDACRKAGARAVEALAGKEPT